MSNIDGLPATERTLEDPFFEDATLLPEQPHPKRTLPSGKATASCSVIAVMFAALVFIVCYTWGLAPSRSMSKIVETIQKYENVTGFTPLDPDPSVLVWDKPPEKGGMFKGRLTVHLDPSDADSPRVNLSVVMAFAKVQPAPRGTVFVHAGGPGTDCNGGGYVGILSQVLEGYNVWAISQRGIGNDAEPSLSCKDRAKLPPVVPGKTYKISDFTDCPCALPDDSPQQGDFQWADIDPTDPEQVRAFFQKTSDGMMKCYTASQYQMKGKNNKTYNFLDYVGTMNLVKDVEQMRLAIGAQKLSLYGISYGTQVMGTYSTVYPENVDKMMVDGCVNPTAQRTAFAEGAARALETVIDELLLNCQRTQETGMDPNLRCNVSKPFDMYAKVLGFAKAQQLTATGKSSLTPFVLTPGLLHGWLLNELMAHQGVENWVEALQTLASLSADSPKERSPSVAKILDVFCKVKGVATWSEYGICVGPGNTNEKSEGTNTPWLIPIAVLGNDLAGRYVVQDALNLWGSASHQFTAAGLTPFVGIAATVLLWPGIPSPIPPIGNTVTPALVVGNLYDPATSYAWSQKMSVAFPAGSMMTWQGVGHGLTYSGNQEHGACVMRIPKYFNEGILPEDGHVCRNPHAIPTRKSAILPYYRR